MDRANVESMKTVTININSNLASSSTPVLVYQYTHNLGYVPQFWGLWNINYSAGLDGKTIRRYGYVTHNTGVGLTANWYYTVDSSSIKLYFHYETSLSGKTTSGTKAVFTGYLFSNGRNNQDYTS